MFPNCCRPVAGKTIETCSPDRGRNLFGEKSTSVAVSHSEAVAVQLLKQRDNNPSAAAEFLAKLTNRRSSVVPNVLADQDGHMFQTIRGQDHFGVDLYRLTGIDQEP